MNAHLPERLRRLAPRRRRRTERRGSPTLSASETIDGDEASPASASTEVLSFDPGRVSLDDAASASDTESTAIEGATILHLARGDVYPPSNGGEMRIWNTSKKFTDFGTVWLSQPSGRAIEDEQAIRVIDTGNPFLKFKTSAIYVWNAMLGISADNGFDRLQSRETVSTFSGLDTEFDIVCCEAPQMLRASKRLAEEYDAELLINKHNAMYELLDQQLELRGVPGVVRRRAVRNLRRFEQAGIDAADAVVFQSADDVKRFTWSEDTVVAVIPNGTDFRAIGEGGDPESVREELGLGAAERICVFVGAFDYDPNEVAANVIADELAPALPDVEFLMVGRDPPNVEGKNVRTPGFVDDLPGVLSLADVAVCPLTMGSGTKLKMLDYLAAGLPIVTTDVGTQGLPLEDGETALVRNSWDEFASAIDTLFESEDRRASLAANAKRLGEEYAWESLMEGYEPVVAELLAGD